MTDTAREAGPGSRSLDGRRALVTSSSRNLGAHIACELAAHGAAVAVTYHASRSAAERVVDELHRRSAGPHVAVQADLSRTDNVGPMVESATERLGGPVDVLVNNYGPFSMVPFHELPEREFRQVWDGNVVVAYLAAQAVASGMRAQGWGRIVNLSAGSAYLQNHSVYGLAKEALVRLTESLALELGPEVTVNAVAPGQIDESAPDVSAIDPTFVDRAVQRTPAARLVTRDEVARVVALLCTAPFDMLTGAVVPLDGGWRFNTF